MPSRAVSSDEGEANKTTGGVSSSASSVLPHHPCGGRLIVSRAIVAFPVVSSFPHPLINGKQAGGGGTGRPRGVGGGLFLSSSGEAAWRVSIPSGGVASFRRAAMIPGGRASSSSRRSPHPRLITPSNTISERKPRQASRQAEAWRPQRSYPSGQTEDKQASKQDENDGRPHPVLYHPTAPRRPHGFHLIPSSTQPPRLTTSTTRRTDETPTGRTTTRQQDNGNGKQERDDGTPDDETTERDAARDARRQEQKQASKQASRGTTIGRREEHNTPFSNLSPDPLPPSLSNPPASIIPPPPPVGG